MLLRNNCLPWACYICTKIDEPICEQTHNRQHWGLGWGGESSSHTQTSVTEKASGVFLQLKRKEQITQKSTRSGCERVWGIVSNIRVLTPGKMERGFKSALPAPFTVPWPPQFQGKGKDAFSVHLWLVTCVLVTSNLSPSLPSEPAKCTVPHSSPWELRQGSSRVSLSLVPGVSLLEDEVNSAELLWLLGDMISLNVNYHSPQNSSNITQHWSFQSFYEILDFKSVN